MNLSPFSTFVIVLAFVMSVAVLRFKWVTDSLVRHLIQCNLTLLSDLCLRTQGDENKHYRELREMMQKMLDKT